MPRFLYIGISDTIQNMAITEFNAAVKQIATERGISVESVLESIEMALVSAYKKDYVEEIPEEKDLPEEDNIEADLDPLTGEVRILKDGKDVTPAGFGRIAAQTAKQVILQKIRETEKDVIMDDFSEKIGAIQSGVIFRVENDVVVIDLGKAHGILLPSEQVQSEDYQTGQRLKVLLKNVKDSGRGPEVIVSRSDPQFVAKLFEQEVPEIASGVVTIEAIAREPGSRTKMAVSSNDERIDPVGSCVGQKGVRVQSVISELEGEKIDIIPFSQNEERFVAAALSPAKVTEVVLSAEDKVAVVSVPEDQQSLAIGKEGQNARLANRLTGWKIDIKGAEGIEGEEFSEVSEEGPGVSAGIWDEVIRKVREEQEDEEEVSQEEESGDMSSDEGDEVDSEEISEKEEKETNEEVEETEGEEKKEE